MNGLTVLATALALGGGLLIWLAAGPWLAERRRARLRVQPFPGPWRAVLARRLPGYREMPDTGRTRLHGAIHVFLNEIELLGCAGMEVTDEVALTIAGHACLMVMNRPGGRFTTVSSVLVYPSAFVAETETVDEAGVHGRSRDVLSGQAWELGQVVLSWEDIEAMAADYNVVVHEFAHQLDHESGDADGAPPLDRPGDYDDWSRVMRTAFERLAADAEAGRETLLDPYGASDPGEFFAVASEAFFQSPGALHRSHPDLYRQLRGYYRVDPATWA